MTYRPDGITEQYIQFHLANPGIYVELVALGRILLGRGYRHIGIGMLWEVLRYNTVSRTMPEDAEYSLNNNYRSRYARTIAAQEEDFRDAFEVRELKESEEVTVMFTSPTDAKRGCAIQRAMDARVPVIVVRGDGQVAYRRGR